MVACRAVLSTNDNKVQSTWRGEGGLAEAGKDYKIMGDYWLSQAIIDNLERFSDITKNHHRS